MNSRKKDFPIFIKNPDLVYLDSSASSQMPSYVIEGIKDYSSSSFSNIHAWTYDMSKDSQDLYSKSKSIISKYLWVENKNEIIFTYNSTYASNIIIRTLGKNNILSKWDKVLVSVAEHHTNIVPWLVLKEEVWIEIDYVGITKDYELDIEDFERKYDNKVKVISFVCVSNVTWKIFDLEEIWKRKREDTIFIVDATQAMPHISLDVKKINCDALYFTWYKMMAQWWIGVLWMKEEYLENLRPIFSWWWAVSRVSSNNFVYAPLPDKYEFWTPNIIWIVSLLLAFEYIESIWWYETIKSHEEKLMKYFLEKLKDFDNIKLIWSHDIDNRVWVFTFYIESCDMTLLAQELAKNNICVRLWRHCAHVLYDNLWISSWIRVSFYLYNDFEDIDRLFGILSAYKKDKI